MTKKLTPLLFSAALLISACAQTADPDLRHTFVRPLEFGGELLLPGGELLEDKYVGAFFKNADYVLLGESHANMTDHLSQAAILEKMARQRLKPALGMEFVNVDDQPALDRFNRGELLPEQLAAALDWPRSVGYPFELYLPIFEVAAQYKIPIYALNIPRQVVRDARLTGIKNIKQTDKKYLPERFIPASAEQSEHLRAFFSRHPTPQTGTGVIPGAQSGAGISNTTEESERVRNIDGFITAQAIWDSVMAERAVRLRRAGRQPVVIIAGQGHVEYGWGIAMRLRAYDQGCGIISVMPWRAPLEGVFMQKQHSPLLDEALPAVFPTADLADIYYYAPLTPLGKTPQGLITGQNPDSKRPQLIVLGIVPESAAEKSGFMPGDVITSVDRHTVAYGEDFYAILAQAAAYGRDSSVIVERGEKKIRLTLPAW